MNANIIGHIHRYTYILAYTGASIPWGNEAEIFIIPILGGNLAIWGETNVYVNLGEGNLK